MLTYLMMLPVTKSNCTERSCIGRNKFKKKPFKVHQVWIWILIKKFWQWSIFHQFSCTTALQQDSLLLFILWYLSAEFNGNWDTRILPILDLWFSNAKFVLYHSDWLLPEASNMWQMRCLFSLSSNRLSSSDLVVVTWRSVKS